MRLEDFRVEVGAQVRGGGIAAFRERKIGLGKLLGRCAACYVKTPASERLGGGDIGRGGAVGSERSALDSVYLLVRKGLDDSRQLVKGMNAQAR